MTTPAEDRLSEVFDALAAAVHPSPDAYRRTQAAWRRRERRRRIAVVVVSIVIVALADVLGLWALRNAQLGPSVIFDAPAPAVVVRDGGPPTTGPGPGTGGRPGPAETPRSEVPPDRPVGRPG